MSCEVKVCKNNNLGSTCRYLTETQELGGGVEDNRGGGTYDNSMSSFETTSGCNPVQDGTGYAAYAHRDDNQQGDIAFFDGSVKNMGKAFNWDNRASSVTIEKLPETGKVSSFKSKPYSADTKTYDISVDGTNIGDTGGTWGHDCRGIKNDSSSCTNPTWYATAAKNGDNLNRDDFYLLNDKIGPNTNDTFRGKPCPGGDALPTNSINKVRCVYDPFNAAKLKTLNAAVEADPPDSGRRIMAADLTTEFCDIPANGNEWINATQTCNERDETNQTRKAYCEVGDNMVVMTDQCNAEHLGGQTAYDTAAAQYCESHPTEDWCGCYNIINGKCTSDHNMYRAGTAGVDKDYAGCEGMMDSINSFKNKGSAMGEIITNNPGCFTSPCLGSTAYIPANKDCDATYQSCSINTSVTGMDASTVASECNLSASTGSGNTPSTPGGGGSSRPDLTPTEEKKEEKGVFSDFFGGDDDDDDFDIDNDDTLTADEKIAKKAKKAKEKKIPIYIGSFSSVMMCIIAGGGIAMSAS